jgi:hypothetical protein
MSNRIDTKIILGKERFKSAVNTDLSLNLPLDNTQKEMDEFDRSVVLSLSDIFDEERQGSSTFRFTINLSFLFFNSYVGTSSYDNFKNQLFYLDAETSFQNDIWSGYPQYQEFDFIRNDNDIVGYTKNPNSHLLFINERSTYYNWNLYLTYPYLNDFNKRLRWDISPGQNIPWVASQGIPYQIINPYTFNGQTLISLKSPVKHNFSVGQYVEITYNNKKYIEEVLSIGNEGYNSENYIINISPIKLGGVLVNGQTGTLKRIVDIGSSGESMSIYYVRKHRVITNHNDAILNKAGFQQNGFGVKNQFQFSQITPNNTSRIAQRHGNQTYNVTFKRDINTLPLIDNLNRPVSEMFLTVINKGYFGWFHEPIGNTNIGMREGYEFNLANFISPYWDVSNTQMNISNIQLGNYQSNNKTFYYSRDLAIGDVVNGDFCEFNQYEQKEYVLSDFYHKMYFNKNHFTLNNVNTNNPPGYYYKPHHKIQLRVYSDYLEEAPIDDVAGVPDYAYYSSGKTSLIWRDIYTYGYVDDRGSGVDFPFINGTHYPKSNIIFRLKPEGNVQQDITAIATPTIDECE